MTIEELCIMYAPTITTLGAALATFIKLGKSLKSQKKEIVESAEMKELKKEMKNMQTEMSCLRKTIEDNKNGQNKEVQEEMDIH